MAANNIVNTVGRRKTSVARASVKKGTGVVRVNNKDSKDYITNDVLHLKALEPLFIADVVDKYDITVKIVGGGQSSQVDAIRQAIARALLQITGKEDLKKKFLAYDRALLVSDTRFKEMKKPNSSKARAKRQKSYR